MTQKWQIPGKNNQEHKKEKKSEEKEITALEMLHSWLKSVPSPP